MWESEAIQNSPVECDRTVGIKASLEVWLNVWGTLQVRQMNLDRVISKFAHSKVTRRVILVIHASFLSPSGSD